MAEGQFPLFTKQEAQDIIGVLNGDNANKDIPTLIKRIRILSNALEGSWVPHDALKQWGA